MNQLRNLLLTVIVSTLRSTILNSYCHSLRIKGRVLGRDYFCNINVTQTLPDFDNV